jgi:hypothetical protein
MRKEDKDFFESLGMDFNSDGLMGGKYAIFCCEEAILICESLRTKNKIDEFSKASWDEQNKMVKFLSEDHSGNTFGVACRLAIAYIPMLRENRINEILN